MLLCLLQICCELLAKSIEGRDRLVPLDKGGHEEDNRRGNEFVGDVQPGIDAEGRVVLLIDMKMKMKKRVS